jgi:hypothetical protein
MKSGGCAGQATRLPCAQKFSTIAPNNMPAVDIGNKDNTVMAMIDVIFYNQTSGESLPLRME